jgi:hypothetical protein
MLEVFTVGGGDYLVNTFNAIAAWTGSGGFKSLIRVCMVMGLIYALLITAMDLDWRAWFRWFVQSTLIYTRADGPDRDGQGHRPRQSRASRPRRSPTCRSGLLRWPRSPARSATT